MSSLSEPRRPRLLPQNRKLRHLKGLSLRNLTFAPTHLRTADDAVLGRVYSSSSTATVSQPTKLEPLHETARLRHPSRSSENLRSAASKSSDALVLRPARPRRVSLNLGAAQATPATRHKTLEEYVDGAVGDVFFSLQVADDPEPVYVSEVRERSANFNFHFFDLGSRREPILTVRLWARRPTQESWGFLLEEDIDLRRLNFIGTLLDRRFPPNALLFHLEDGVYSLDFPTRASEPKRAPSAPTCSYNALMRLANLESSIEDAMATRDRITAQINEILADAAPHDDEDGAAGAAQEEAKLADKYVAAQQRTNRLAARRRDELRASLELRRAAIAEGRGLQARTAEDVEASRDKLAAARRLAEQTEQQMHGQRRRICSELGDVFPITPVPGQPPLSFQICGIPLPNSTYDASAAKTISEDALSAGLGLVALLTHHLQLYLGRPLPYPLTPFGSRSTARDDISQLGADRLPHDSPQRDFPLFLPRGGSTAGQWRFEYGWFLLNKDIEALCASQGLKVVDIRHTLPNLKYLLYVGSAGSDEVPERKKGGVRGLWLGRLQGRVSSLQADDGNDSAMDSATGSRRGSADSEAMGKHAEALRSAISLQNGNDDGGIQRLPFDNGPATFTLRTKGLREDVSK